MSLLVMHVAKSSAHIRNRTRRSGNRDSRVLRQKKTSARLLCDVQRPPVPRSSEYPAFRRDHWGMGRPSVR